VRPTTTRLRRALVGAIALTATATVALVIPAIVSPVNAALVPTVIKTSDFEDGTVQGWALRGTVETVANSTTVAHGGTHSLSITGRTASWNGPQLDLLGVMQKGPVPTAFTLNNSACSIG
jgi:endo-1,4-beta-xylanase